MMRVQSDFDRILSINVIIWKIDNNNPWFCKKKSLEGVKQYPQAGLETAHTMCQKSEEFRKSEILEYFVTNLYVPIC